MASNQWLFFGKRLILLFLNTILSILLLLLAYLMLALILGFIPVNSRFTSQQDGVEIFIGTNGVHTDIIMPAKNDILNWNQIVPPNQFSGADFTFQFISVGWGDKGFYIHTRRWADLTVNTALKALFVPSDAAMHVTYLRNAPGENERYVSITVSEQQYRHLTRYILSFFVMKEGKTLLIEGANYTEYDNFYEAYESYTLFHTSNNWTNQALKNNGIRAAVWSPFDKPIMYQARKASRGVD